MLGRYTAVETWVSAGGGKIHKNSYGISSPKARQPSGQATFSDSTMLRTDAARSMLFEFVPGTMGLGGFGRLQDFRALTGMIDESCQRDSSRRAHEKPP
jgi:hypothetical protein